MKKDFQFNHRALNLFYCLFFLFALCGFVFFPSNKNVHLISKYKLAKKEKNCLELQKLYSNTRFSLKDLARIQAYKLCPQLDDPDFQWEAFPQWLKKLALKAWFHRASQQDNKEEFIKASFTLSQFTPLYEEKIRYTQHALKVARKIQSPEKDKLVQYLYTISPSRNPKPKFANYMQVARDYKKRNAFKYSIIYYRKVLNSKKSNLSMKHESYTQLKWLYKTTKQRKKYLKTVSEFNIFQNKIKNRSPRFKKNYLKSQISLARSYWNSDKTPLALKTLKTAGKNKDRLFLDEIYWLIGKIYEEKNQLTKAMLYFKKGKQALKNKHSSIKEKLIWSLAWNARKLRQYNKALQYLNELEQTSKDYSPQFVFWKAQVLEEMGRKKQADQKYKELIDEAPLSFHGIIAHHKINHPLSLNLVAIKPSKNDPYRLVDDLSLAEENSLVLEFVKHKLNEHKKSNILNEDTLLQLFRRSVNLGIYMPFFQFVGSLSLQEKSQFMKKYAYTLFPIIYQKEVNKASQLFNTSNKIIYSIIRQESAFNPRALSLANAVGLMQILPSVAREMSRKKAIVFRKFYDLYNPKINIFLGTAYYQELVKKDGGYLILNTASYNAGRRAVQRWLKKFSTTNPVEFIQNIPYKETQKYVRLIIRNLICYMLLEDPDNTIPFPKWILDLPHNDVQSLRSITKEPPAY